MAKRTSSTDVKKFTIEAPKVSGAVAKLSIPRVPIADLGKTISNLIEQMNEGGVEGKLVKGTLTVY